MKRKKREIRITLWVLLTIIALIGAYGWWYTYRFPRYETVEGALNPTAAVSVLTPTAATTSPTTASTTSNTAKPSTTLAHPRKALLLVPPLGQYPSYPTGCEATAAVMALRYSGENVTIESFIEDHLPCSRDFYHYEGKFYGPSPYQYFLGDPRSEQSYGCMAPVIERAMVHYLGNEDRVVNVTDSDLDTLCHQYIDKGIPVLFWASIGMSPILQGRQWILPDGSLYTWPSGEHCLLLVGYDDDHYYCNDPTTGKRTAYDRRLTEQRYATMGKQALVVLPK